MQCPKCKTEMSRECVDEEADYTYEASRNQESPQVWEIYRYACSKCGHEKYTRENPRPSTK